MYWQLRFTFNEYLITNLKIKPFKISNQLSDTFIYLIWNVEVELESIYLFRVIYFLRHFMMPNIFHDSLGMSTLMLYLIYFEKAH